jgi:hypothetical protein
VVVAVLGGSASARAKEAAPLPAMFDVAARGFVRLELITCSVAHPHLHREHDGSRGARGRSSGIRRWMSPASIRAGAHEAVRGT